MAEGGPAVLDRIDAHHTPEAVSKRVRLLRVLGGAFHVGTAAIAAGVLLLIATLVFVLATGAWSSIVQFGLGFLTGSTWDPVHDIFGAAPAIAGTVLTSAFALLIAIPIALGVALFLSEIAPGWLRRPLGYVVDLSAAIPSVVFGFWAFIFLVPLSLIHISEPTRP